MPFVDAHDFEHPDADIFLSCSHAEDGRKVDLLADKLSDFSFKIFYTRQNMRPGYSYDTMIRRYLKSCRTILICWSPSAVTSDYVNAEAEYGRTNKRLVACKVLECELMPPFNTFQTADLTTWNGEDEHPTWRALVALLQHRKSGTIEPYREPTAQASPPELSRRQKLRDHCRIAYRRCHRFLLASRLTDWTVLSTTSLLAAIPKPPRDEPPYPPYITSGARPTIRKDRHPHTRQTQKANMVRHSKTRSRTSEVGQKATFGRG